MRTKKQTSFNSPSFTFPPLSVDFNSIFVIDPFSQSLHGPPLHRPAMGPGTCIASREPIKVANNRLVLTVGTRQVFPSFACRCSDHSDPFETYVQSAAYSRTHNTFVWLREFDMDRVRRSVPIMDGSVAAGARVPYLKM